MCPYWLMGSEWLDRQGHRRESWGDPIVWCAFIESEPFFSKHFIFLQKYCEYKRKIKIDASRINTEFPGLESWPGSSLLVEIPQIFNNCMALCLLMAFHPLPLLFLSENVADRDKFCFFRSPAPNLHIFILLW